jgi:signal peptidase II
MNLNKSHRLIINDYFLWSLGIFFLFLDQISKFVFMKYHYFFNFNLLRFNYVKNYGVAFSLFSNYNFFFHYFLFFLTILSLFFIIFIYKNYLPEINFIDTCLYFNKNFKKILFSKFLVKFFLILLFFGILGNFIDRVFYGFVRDFIYVKFFSVFNLADIYITISIVYLLLFFLCNDYKYKKS